MKFDVSNRNLQNIMPDILKKNLQFLSSSFDELIDEANVESALFDSNCLSKLGSIDIFLNLKHLSLTNNRLIEINAISKLQHLEFVNLLNNSLTNLNPFKELRKLKWINVSGNQISCLEPLNYNTELEYIDASNNEMSTTGNLTNLTQLETLILSGNEIYELSTLPIYLTKNIRYLQLSHNLIEDLNQICHLAHFDKIDSLSIDINPCTSYTNDRIFDYRPFVINWCPSLLKLDGVKVNPKEYLKAEWLYSQGKGKQFRPGQSQQLVEYLIKTCPYNWQSGSLQEEFCFSNILPKKANYVSEALNDQDLMALDITSMKTETKETKENSVVNTDTYDRKLNKYSKLINSIDPYHESEKINNMNDINLKSSSSKNFDQENTSKLDQSLSKYIDYDNRPIQPLDQQKLNEKLTMYPEMSHEELEELKTRTVQHIRSKTSEPIKNSRQSLRNQYPTRIINKSPMTRQLSFNSNQNMSNYIPKKTTKTTTSENNINKPASIKPTPQSTSKPTSSYLPKRSKTENELNIKPKLANALTPTKFKSKYNPKNYSPLTKQTSAGSYISQVNYSKTEISDSGSLVASRKTSNVVKPACLFDKTRSISTDKVNSSDLPKSMNNEVENCEVSLAKLNKDQLKHSEIHSKIQKQRQEMLLNKQRNLNEFRNQLKLEHEKSLQQRQNNYPNESFTKVNKDIKLSKKKISFEDTCAVKIQSLWRGYRFRKTFSKKKLFRSGESYHYLLECVKNLRSDLISLTNDHKRLGKLYQEDCQKLNQAFLCVINKIGDNESCLTSNSATRTSLSNELLNENKILKEKIAFLEEKYSKLDVNLTQYSESAAETRETVAPCVQIYPPIRVRLQKLNERRVALKWNHNPLNNLTEIHGYHIYINGKLCGKMSPNDMVASINGIQEEGEYRIFIRSFFRAIESSDSNEVVTRVKRKTASPNQYEKESSFYQNRDASKSQNSSSLESNSNHTSTLSSSTSCERKDSPQPLDNEIKQQSRFARKPKVKQTQQILDNSNENESTQPFDHVSTNTITNKIVNNSSIKSPNLSNMTDENIENTSSLFELAYLNNMRPLTESQMPFDARLKTTEYSTDLSLE